MAKMSPVILRQGEIIFLGSPTFKGAQKWRYPTEPNSFVKHSLVRNSGIVFELMQQQLHIEPLISHVIKSEQASEAYEGLRTNKDQFNGVLFDGS